VICTSRRATVVVVALSLGALTVSVVQRISWKFHIPAYRHGTAIVFLVLLPVTVFIVNMIVLCEVRRASNSAAVNIGLQQHHKSTSSNRLPSPPANDSVHRQHDSLVPSTSSVQQRRRQPWTSTTSPVNLVQLRRSYRHARHHFAPLRSPHCTRRPPVGFDDRDTGQCMVF